VAAGELTFQGGGPLVDILASMPPGQKALRFGAIALTFVTGVPLFPGAVASRRGPNGEVSGHLNQKCGEGSPRPFYARGPVVCLDVQGNRAGFVWQVEETSDQSFQGLYEHFSVRDNRPPGKGVPDMVVSAPNTPVLPPSCPPITETVPVLKGNIVVHDSTPERFRRHTRRPPAGRRPVALRRGDKC